MPFVGGIQLRRAPASLWNCFCAQSVPSSDLMSSQGFYQLRQDLGMVSCMGITLIFEMWKVPKTWYFWLPPGHFTVYISQNNHGRWCPDVQSSGLSLLCFMRRAAELLIIRAAAPGANTDLLHFHQHSQNIPIPPCPRGMKQSSRDWQDYQEPVPSRLWLLPLLIQLGHHWQPGGTTKPSQELQPWLGSWPAGPQLNMVQRPP